MQWQGSVFPDIAASIEGSADGFLPASAAWNADTGDIDSYLAYQTRFARGMDVRTQAAHLVAFYSHQFSIAVVAIYMKAGRVLVMDPQRVLLKFEAVERFRPGSPSDARRFHMRFSGGLLPIEGDALAHFHNAIVAHLTAVIGGLNRRTGFSSVAQWRLAADSLAGAFLETGRALGREAEALEAALAIVNRDGSPLASPGLRFETIAAVVNGQRMERTFRLRGGCCLFYRTEGGRFCDNCVLLDAESQRLRLRTFLEDAVAV